MGPNMEIGGTTCCICLESFEEGDPLKRLPCRHTFHTDCITPWLTERSRLCPLCKESVNVLSTDPLLPNGREGEWEDVQLTGIIIAPSTAVVTTSSLNRLTTG